MGEQIQSSVVVVRTDEQPLIWIWWWFFFRLKETFRIIGQGLLLILQAWGIVRIPDREKILWKRFFYYLKAKQRGNS
ncbi:hypothetical protein [Mastigocladopsis repens]|uniref:hypothetical protein n=1 Tax=Mastigocladopsis repens TaxID=221287 RepID=UPI0003771531|nr:hypothetical protein [Mastigocladopsis repens]